MGFRGLGFRVKGVGVEGLGFRGCRVSDFGVGVQGLGCVEFRVGLGLQQLGCDLIQAGGHGTMWMWGTKYVFPKGPRTQIIGF